MADNLTLPEHLVHKLTNVHEHGKDWLEQFPKLVKEVESKWGINVTGLVAELSYNVVAYAEDEATTYILKMSPPNDEFNAEIGALRLYDGDGIANVLKADETVGAALLERIHPGDSLWHSPDDKEATEAAAILLNQLWRPVPSEHSFRTLESWSESLSDFQTSVTHPSRLPERLLDRAVYLRQELCQEQPTTLLHADLHHGNILRGTRQPFVAIDPKGIVGSKGYDVATFLGNPFDVIDRPDYKDLSTKRLDIFSSMLGIDKDELIAWGIMHAVLSACWTLEDGGTDITKALMVAETLERL